MCLYNEGRDCNRLIADFMQLWNRLLAIQGAVKIRNSNENCAVSEKRLAQYDMMNFFNDY